MLLIFMEKHFIPAVSCCCLNQEADSTVSNVARKSPLFSQSNFASNQFFLILTNLTQVPRYGFNLYPALQFIYDKDSIHHLILLSHFINLQPFSPCCPSVEVWPYCITWILSWSLVSVCFAVARFNGVKSLAHYTQNCKKMQLSSIHTKLFFTTATIFFNSLIIWATFFTTIYFEKSLQFCM